MYNRYIPQSDGSYRRSYVPDRAPQNPPQPRREAHRPQSPSPSPPFGEQEQKDPEHTPKPSVPAPVCPHNRQRCPYSAGRNTQRKHPEPEACENDRKDGNILDFLRNLLPKDFDTGDLLVVLLLLLMAGDCKEDQNSALLTLVLYLFM